MRKLQKKETCEWSNYRILQQILKFARVSGFFFITLWQSMILTESTMKYILTFILSFLSFLVCSQNITITDIPTIDQLPVNAIHRVFRDSEGYMWYGTVNGLCRDDGYHVKVFRSDIETPGLNSMYTNPCCGMIAVKREVAGSQ